MELEVSEIRLTTLLLIRDCADNALKLRVNSVRPYAEFQVEK